MKRPPMAWTAAGIIAIALAARFWGIDWGLPMKYAHVDESVVIFYAMRFLSGDLHPHVFFDYPSLFLYALALLWRVYHAFGWLLGIFGPMEQFIQRYLARDAADIYLLARSLSALCGVATIAVLCAAGRLLHTGRVTLLAALLLAINPLHVLHCHYATPDAAAVFLTMGSAFLLVRGVARDIDRDIILGCMVAGFGASTKYYPAVLLVNAALFPCFSRSGYQPGRVRTILLGGCAAVGAFLLGTPFALLDFPAFWSRFSVIYTHVAQPQISGLWPRLGTTLRSLGDGIGPGCLLLCITGMLRRNLPAAERYLHTFPLVLLATISPWKAVSPHYLLPLFPFLFTIAAAELDRIARRTRPWVFAAGAGLCATWFIPPLMTTLLTLAAPDTRQLAADWVRANVPAGSSILRFPYTAEFKPGEPYVVTVDWEGTYGPDTYDRFQYVIVADTVVDRGDRFVLEREFRGRALSRFHNPTVRIYRNTGYPPARPSDAGQNCDASSAAPTSRTSTKRSKTSSVSRDTATGSDPMNDP